MGYLYYSICLAERCKKREDWEEKGKHVTAEARAEDGPAYDSSTRPS